MYEVTHEFILTAASPAEHGAALAVTLLALLLLNAFTVPDNQDPQLKAAAPTATDPTASKKTDQLHAELLAGAIRCKTVSFDDPSQIDYTEFPKLHR